METGNQEKLPLKEQYKCFPKHRYKGKNNLRKLYFIVYIFHYFFSHKYKKLHITKKIIKR